MEIFETVMQVLVVGYSLLAAGLGFSAIGRTPQPEHRNGSVGFGAMVYGLFTVGIVSTWEMRDFEHLLAMLILLGLMWVPWLTGVIALSAERERRPYALWQAITNFAASAAVIALVIRYWH